MLVITYIYTGDNIFVDFCTSLPRYVLALINGFDLHSSGRAEPARSQGGPLKQDPSHVSNYALQTIDVQSKGKHLIVGSMGLPHNVLAPIDIPLVSQGESTRLWSPETGTCYVALNDAARWGFRITYLRPSTFR